MTPTNDPVPPILYQLWNLSAQIQQTAEHLPQYQQQLGEEHIAYVREASYGILQSLHGMMQSCVAMATEGKTVVNPLEDREGRHDMRNQIAVVKGFSDLMMMDVDRSHPAMQVLDHLRTLSDQYCSLLDSVKSPDSGVSMFAAP